MGEESQHLSSKKIEYMIHKSYKYKIYPNKTKQLKLNKTFGCTRFIWNKNVESFNNHSEFRSSTEYRKEYEFLQEISMERN